MLLRGDVIAAAAQDARLREEAAWPIRAVIVTPFAPAAGVAALSEAQSWIARERLVDELAFPAGAHPLRINAERTVLAMVSGTTLASAAASLMALGLDARFDLRRAYFLVNGIAGVDPTQASVGSAAWASFVVGDVARELDAREAPADWPYGVFPVGATAPRPAAITPVPWARSNLFELNAKLARWAFELTRGIELPDDPAVAALRAGFAGTSGLEAAARPPVVLQGDVFCSNRFWHGATLTQHARDWVRLYTEGKGTFVMSAMEDAGFMTAAERLAAAGLIDAGRILLLRTASNYTMPGPGQTAVESIHAPLLGTGLALECAHVVGSRVLEHLVERWNETAGQIPGD